MPTSVAWGELSSSPAGGGAYQWWHWPGKTAGIMILSRVNLWCRDHDPGSFRVAGIILVVAREIPAAICNPGPLTTPRGPNSACGMRVPLELTSGHGRD